MTIWVVDPTTFTVHARDVPADGTPGADFLVVLKKLIRCEWVECAQRHPYGIWLDEEGWLNGCPDRNGIFQIMVPKFHQKPEQMAGRAVITRGESDRNGWTQSVTGNINRLVDYIDMAAPMGAGVFRRGRTRVVTAAEWDALQKEMAQ